jgi:hypothetical protein
VDIMTFNGKCGAPGFLLSALVLAAGYMAHVAAAQGAVPQACVTAPKSPLIVNIRDKGAKGDGRTDDTAAIQAAIDEVGGTGDTVLVPKCTYMVEPSRRSGCAHPEFQVS